MANDRPKRRAIPLAVKITVCIRQHFRCKDCESEVSAYPNTGTAFDHRPALRMRNICPDGSDFDPPQHSEKHIDALCKDCHKTRTFVKNGADFSDLTKIARERRREKKRTQTRQKRKWPKGKAIPSRPWPKKVKP